MDAIQNGLALKMLRKVGFDQNSRINTSLPPYVSPAWMDSSFESDGDVKDIVAKIRELLDELESSDTVGVVLFKLRATIDEIASQYSIQ